MAGLLAAVVVAACGSTSSDDDPDESADTTVSTDASSTEDPTPTTEPSTTSTTSTTVADDDAAPAATTPGTDPGTAPVVDDTPGRPQQIAGELVWSTELPFDPDLGPLTLVGASELVMVASRSPQLDVTISTMFALDPSTGEVRWAVDRRLGPVRHHVQVDADVVVFDEFDEIDESGPPLGVRLAAVDAETGDPVWSRAVNRPSPLWYVIGGTIILVDETRVIGVEPATGDEQWVVELVADPAPDALVVLLPAVVRANGMVLLAGVDREFELIGLGPDGDERWRRPVDDVVLTADHLPAESARTVALLLGDEFTGVDLVTGEDRWSFPVDVPADLPIRSDPSGVAVVCLAQRPATDLIVVDLDDGSILWNELLEPPTDGVGAASTGILGYAEGIVLTSTILFGEGCGAVANAGQISVRSILTGTELWSIDAGPGLLVRPVGVLDPFRTDDPGIEVAPSVLVQSAGTWTLRDAVSGDIVAGGEVEPGAVADVMGRQVFAIADFSTIVGSTGSVEVGDPHWVAGSDAEQLYVWTADGVLLAIR